MKKIAKYALINSLGTALYVALIAFFIYNLGNWFPDDSKTPLIPIAMLMLFVFSVAFTGSLVFGRPIMWFLDGKKREALLLVTYTLGIFLMVTLAIFILLTTLII